MKQRGAVVLWRMLCVLSAAAGAGPLQAGPVQNAAVTIVASRPASTTVVDSGGVTVNPHSDLIFRATGATSCLDCHRADKAGRMNVQVLDNALVQELKAKAKGIHGPGRFADCLRCHAGGDKGVEKYRKGQGAKS